MNPLFMQMMGMNFMMPGCFCGGGLVHMPYNNDNLGFLNFPIFRNTSYDYLLDPNLALKQCQQRWANGGLYGGTMLPGFTFPSMPSITGMPQFPWMPGYTPAQPKTKEQEEAEKKKAEEAKKPEAVKAQKLNAVYNQIKKLAADEKTKFPEIPEELSKKAEEAMKKETASEQLAAMKEVFAAIPAETIRKTVLADSNVKEKLRRAGYNFNLNKYSLKNNDITTADIDHIDRLRQLHTDVEEKNYNELQVIAGLLTDEKEKTKILSIISSWNSRFNGPDEKGILRFIANYLPTGNDAIGKLPIVKDNVKTFTLALLSKADNYDDLPKISSARDSVKEKLDDFINETDAKNYKEKIYNLANECDKLYARLRMQEAVSINTYLNKSFSYINEAKEGVITNNTVIEETKRDLESENISYPQESDLDAAPVTEEIRIQDEQELKDLDEQYKDNAKGMADALVERGDLEKVEGKENVYQTTKSLTGGTPRYFGVKDNKLYEIYKQGDKFVKPANAPEITSATEISDYNSTVDRANRLSSSSVGALEKVNIPSKYPLFKAKYANEYYVIKDNKFYHIINAKSVAKSSDGKDVNITFKSSDKAVVSLSDIDSDDLEEFTDSELKTKEQAQADAKKAERADVTKVGAHLYGSLHDIENNEELDKISEEICGAKGHFKKSKSLSGYFTSDKPKFRIYKYDVKTGKLKCIENLKALYYIGYAQQTSGELTPVAEVFMDKEYTGDELLTKIQEYGAKFRNHLNGRTSDEEVILAHKKMNTIIAMNDPIYTINFIKGYKNAGGLWSTDDMCRQIVTENDFSQKIGAKNLDGMHYVREFAKLIKSVINITDFDKNSEDYDKLCKIANGEDVVGAAAVLDKIINKVIEAYDKKGS